jgi:hypothetical protein
MKRFYFVVLAVIWAILTTAALAQENSSQRQQPQPPAAAQQPSEPSEPHTVTFGGRGSEKDKTDELLFKMHCRNLTASP